jgi:hypothetical protein
MKKFVILFAIFVAAALIGCGGGGGGGGSVATNPLGPVVTDTGTGTGTDTGTGTSTGTGTDTSTGTGTDVSANYILAYDGAKIATHATNVVGGWEEILIFDENNDPVGAHQADAYYTNFHTNQKLHNGAGIGAFGFEIFNNKLLVCEATTGLIYALNGESKSIYSGIKDNFAATIDNSLITAATYFSVQGFARINTRLYISNSPTAVAYIDQGSDRVRVTNLPGRYYYGIKAVDGELYLINDILATADKYTLFKYNNGEPINTGWASTMAIRGIVSYKSGLLIAGQGYIYYYANGVSSTWLDGAKIGDIYNGKFNITKNAIGEIYITHTNRNIYKVTN